MDARPLQHGPEKGHTPAHVTPTAPAASSVWRTTAALGAVVALILLLAWGYRAVASGGRLALSNRKPGLIEVLSRTALSPRQSLCLVRIGPRLVLLGVTPESVRALDVIPDADVAAQLTGQAAARRADSSSAEFARCLEQQSRAYAAEVPVDDAPTPEDDRLAELKQRLSDTIARLRATAAQPEPGRTCPAGREVA
jgi:flagellar biogenesis protein FliO